jgi:signal peptidase
MFMLSRRYAAPVVSAKFRWTRWWPWIKSLGTEVVVILAILGSVFAFMGAWPPVMVPESTSMQHGDSVSYVGVIDIGDLIFVQAAPTRADVITYIQGRGTGYATYGDYGDVIVFRNAQDPSSGPIAHRAIMYIIPNGSGADVPDLSSMPTTEWQGYAKGLRINSVRGLTGVMIHHMGYRRNLGITFNLSYFARAFHGLGGYITMGDNNAYHACNVQADPCAGGTPYDTSWFPAQGDIIGHALGEIPWFGLLKMLLEPSPACAQGWADPCAPLNSWDDLAFSLSVIVTLPFILEGASWVWSTYGRPRIRPRLPRIKGEVPRPLQREGVPATEPNNKHREDSRPRP